MHGIFFSGGGGGGGGGGGDFSMISRACGNPVAIKSFYRGTHISS